MSVVETLGYRSPISKLFRFFRRSRDQWKAKCKAAKGENKSLKIRLAKMKASRDFWKARAQSAERGNETVRAQPVEETKNRCPEPSRGRGRRGARLDRGRH